MDVHLEVKDQGYIQTLRIHTTDYTDIQDDIKHKQVAYEGRKTL
jgi:hypothetical protein